MKKTIILIAVILALCALAYFTDVKTVLTIIIAIVVISALLIFLLFYLLSKGKDRQMKEKYGEDFQEVFRKLGEGARIPCKPDSECVDRNLLCGKTHVDLPEFDIVECIGSVPYFQGDYDDTVKVLFRNSIPESVLQTVQSYCTENLYGWHGELECDILVPYSKDAPKSDYFWSIKIVDKDNAIIKYGRV